MATSPVRCSSGCQDGCSHGRHPSQIPPRGCPQLALTRARAKRRCWEQGGLSPTPGHGEAAAGRRAQRSGTSGGAETTVV